MRIDRRGFLRSSAAILGGAMLVRPGFAQQGGFEETLDAVLRAPVERGDIPGVVGALTNSEDTFYSSAFGERELGGGVAMTEDTVFNMASMTKAITGACAMQLVEQGKLDLTSPISKWIPSAAELQVAESWNDDGQPVLRPPSREITLTDLMTHTSGMAYTQWDARLNRYAESQGGLPPLDYANEATWMQPLMFDPGTRWEYGIAIDWIGRLVQEVSGQSLGTYMRDNIFAPLGMESTGYAVTPDMAARQARIHQRGEDGTLTVMEPLVAANPVREYGGGGLNGTAPDYLRFIRMILNGGTGNGNQILKPETVADMSRNHMGDLRVEMLHTTNPARSLDAEFFPGLEKTWGLSFMINEEQAPTGRPAGSLAWAGLYNTFFWIDPTNKVGGVFMSQILPFVDTPTLQAFYDFETAYYDSAAA